MLVQKKTISTQVADAIRRRILSGEYAANLQLRQEHIAVDLGVSRIPVREALHQLHSEGFVTLVSHKGAVVTPVSLDEILELHELRARLETWLLALAIPRMTEEHLAAAALSADRFGANSADPDRAFELNWDFHKTLYAASGRKATIDIIGRIYQQIERYTRMIVKLIDYNFRSDAEHHKLIELCRAGDAKRASKVLEAHIMDGGRLLIERLPALRDEGHPSDRLPRSIAS